MFALSMVAAPLLYAAVGMDGIFWLTAVLAAGAIGVLLWAVPVAPPIPIMAPAKASPPDRPVWIFRRMTLFSRYLRCS